MSAAKNLKGRFVREVHADRVEFLERDYEIGSSKANGMDIGWGADASVCVFTDPAYESGVTICIRGGHFGFQSSLSSADARLLAQALLAGADEADAVNLTKQVAA